MYTPHDDVRLWLLFIQRTVFLYISRCPGHTASALHLHTHSIGSGVRMECPVLLLLLIDHNNISWAPKYWYIYCITIDWCMFYILRKQYILFVCLSSCTFHHPSYAHLRHVPFCTYIKISPTAILIRRQLDAMDQSTSTRRHTAQAKVRAE